MAAVAAVAVIAVLPTSALLPGWTNSPDAVVSAEPVHPGDPIPATPDTASCPYRVIPAPPVDTSEVPPPGQSAPPPLPVPRPPVGGDRLAACGVITAGNPSAIPRGITSAGWLVADAGSGQVLAAKDPHGRYRPASTIKTLLALVVLDELNLDQVVIGTREDYGMEGDSAGIGPGGRYTVRQLLQGLLMVSGNDCANALARTLGGRETALSKMNAMAQRLGAQDTRAASPSGLDAPGMSTSPYDLALIFRAGLKNPTFRDLISHVSAPFPGFPRLPDVPGDTDHPGYQMQSQNRLLVEGYPGIIGGKTGFTDDARKTFVGAVDRRGRTLIVVQMFGLNEAGDSYWDQATALLDHGFTVPADASVGTLVTPTVAQPAATNNAGTPRASARDDDGSETSDSWTGRLLGGTVGLVIVLGLIYAALRINRRSR
ncbi:D-alanyl-D-alanine carboxypeptidase [Williamsia sp. CHRR-6]|nr:D-alanyl-D-alanine carboxypeptidase [Williamsia sp. CHRR-6]